MGNRNTSILFYVNNQRVEISDSLAFMPLAEFMRTKLGLPGTKIVCAEGDCGACTVLVGRPENESDLIKYAAINSCIAPLYSLNGHQIITVEGVGDPDHLHPVQEEMIKNHGAQCGYCTPGFICSLAAMVEEHLKKNERLTEKQVKNHITGNLCRCTGYEPIIKSGTAINLKTAPSLAQKFHHQMRNRELFSRCKSECEIKGIDYHIYIPTDLSQACYFKAHHQDAKIVAGSTDLGVLVNKGKANPRKVLSLKNIAEFFHIKKLSNGVFVGSQVTLAQLEKFIAKEAPEFSRLLKIFASPQIKNTATLAGNIVNASPIADTIPFLMVSEAEIHIENFQGSKIVPIIDFYRGYKEFELSSQELVKGIWIPQLTEFNQQKLFKVSLRKDLDISAVTFAGAFKVANKKIIQSRISYGGIGPTVIRSYEVEKFLNGKSWSLETFIQAGLELEKHIKPLSDVRGSKEFRMQVAKNLLEKFYHEAEA